MPLNCVAYGCHNHNQKENKPGFFRFPNNDHGIHQGKMYIVVEITLGQVHFHLRTVEFS